MAHEVSRLESFAGAENIVQIKGSCLEKMPEERINRRMKKDAVLPEPEKAFADMLEESKIQSLMEQPIEEAAESLIAETIRMGADDNTTIILAEVQSELNEVQSEPDAAAGRQIEYIQDGAEITSEEWITQLRQEKYRSFGFEYKNWKNENLMLYWTDQEQFVKLYSERAPEKEVKIYNALIFPDYIGDTVRKNKNKEGILRLCAVLNFDLHKDRTIGIWQVNLQKLIEGRISSDEEVQKQMQKNCRNISFVFCGSFETPRNNKEDRPSAIGFSSSKETEALTLEVTEEDLVLYGNIRREIADRIDKIVMLQPLDADDFEQIMQSKQKISPVRQIAGQYGIEISLDEKTRRMMAEEASESRLGCRYIRSKIQGMLDDQIFEDPYQKKFQLSMA